MPEILIRPAVRADLARITEIYNHYVVNTPVTFDVEPYTVERRTPWFAQFAPTGRYRLLVAEHMSEPLDGAPHLQEEYAQNLESGLRRCGSRVIAYAGTTRFRPKAAYDTTVETTIYCAPQATGKGLGRRLYSALFAAIATEDIRRLVAGYALPNPASAALHASFGFKQVGVFSEVGRKFGRYWDVVWTERALRVDL